MHGGVAVDLLGDARDGVHDGGVVAAVERARDRGERGLGVGPREVHRDLAWPGDRGGAARPDERVVVDLEGGADDVLHAADRRALAEAGRARRVQAADDVVDERLVEFAAGQSAVGDRREDGALEGADAVGDAVGEVERFARSAGASSSWTARRAT